MATAPPGWLPDPTGRHEHRYWDGSHWTDHVSGGGVVASDPLAPAVPGEADPHGVAPPTVPVHRAGTGDVYAPAPGHDGAAARSGPSTGLLVGLGLLVVVLFGAIVLVLMDDAGNGTATSGTTGTTGGASDAEDPLGISTSVDQMVAQYGGAISEDEARCMISEMASWAIDAGYTGDQDLEDLPREEQIAATSAMLTCVEAEAVMESLVADGFLADGATQEQADCAAESVVSAIGVETILTATVTSPEDPASALPPEDQDAMVDAMVDCT